MTGRDTRPAAHVNRPRLEGWKEIAVYLGRTVRTVQRWERHQALPVRRHLHASSSTAYAYAIELDAWLASRAPDANTADTMADVGASALAGAEKLTAMSRYYWAERTVEGFRKSIALAKAALSRNPAYAPAHVALAIAHATRASYGVQPPAADVEIALTHARTAISLDAGLAGAH